MKLSKAAIGLAAMGAGWLVARAVINRRGGEFRSGRPAPEPPSPNQLIGTPESHLSAAEAAETFRTSQDRPV